MQISVTRMLTRYWNTDNNDELFNKIRALLYGHMYFPVLLHCIIMTNLLKEKWNDVSKSSDFKIIGTFEEL